MRFRLLFAIPGVLLAGRGSSRALARGVVALAVTAVAIMGGCDTVSQDLSDVGKSIMMPTGGEAARMALDPHDPDRRRQGTLYLSNAYFGGDEVYLRMYREYVRNEPDPLVRAVAVRALARHGTPEDALLIATRLTDENVQVRWEAAKGLQRLHNPAVVGDLLTALRNSDEHSDVRVAAACALGQYPEDRVFQGLVAALDARELAVNVSADRSLETLTGQSFGVDPRAWLNWYNGHADNPFGDGHEYLYPTYQRAPSWLEKLAFWAPPIQEQPGVPVGLAPESGRRTYQDGDGDGDEGEGKTEEK